MRLSEISDKEIIDYTKGERLGVLGETDLLIDEKTGTVHAFILPTMKWFQIRKKEQDIIIYWQQIKKIGEDMIIIDLHSYE